MKHTRRLTLRREALAELENGQLAGIVGGTHIATACDCLTHGLSCERCPTPSLPLNDCIFSTGDLVISCGMCLS